jgi:hypothetical protein
MDSCRKKPAVFGRRDTRAGPYDSDAEDTVGGGGTAAGVTGPGGFVTGGGKPGRYRSGQGSLKPQPFCQMR